MAGTAALQSRSWTVVTGKMRLWTAALPANSLLRLELHHHVFGVAPVRHGIGVGRGRRVRVTGPVGLVHHREYVVGHQRDDRHLPHHELDVVATELDALGIVEADLARVLDDLVELRVAPALPVARRLRLAGRR